MEAKEIFNKFAVVVLDSIAEINDWNKAILYIKLLKGSTGFESSYINLKNEEIRIDSCADYFTHKAVKGLYEITQNEFPKHKDWNRAIFALYPDNKFEIEYIWDQELQDQVDNYNNQIS